MLLQPNLGQGKIFSEWKITIWNFVKYWIILLGKHLVNNFLVLWLVVMREGNNVYLLLTARAKLTQWNLYEPTLVVLAGIEFLTGEKISLWPVTASWLQHPFAAIPLETTCLSLNVFCQSKVPAHAANTRKSHSSSSLGWFNFVLIF